MFTSRLKDFLKDHGWSFTEGRQSFIADCPACSKAGHFYIRRKDGRSICFRCGVSYGWRGLVGLIARCTPSEVDRIFYGESFGSGDDLGQGQGLDLSVLEPQSHPSQTQSKPIYLGPDFIPWSGSPQAIEYLVSRGVDDPTTLRLYDVRYHPAMHAVVFPVFYHGKIFGWQARKIAPNPGEPKLLTSTGFDKSRFFLNWDRASKARRVFWVEGPFDCIKVDRARDQIDAIPIASLGKIVSPHQIKLILDSPAIEEVFIGLDEDAWEEAYDVIDRIGTSKKVHRVRAPEGKDFGDCTRNEVVGSVVGAHGVNQDLYLEVQLKWGS